MVKHPDIQALTIVIYVCHTYRHSYFLLDNI